MSGWNTIADRHWNTLAERIATEYTARTRQLAEGFAKSHEEYCERVGYLSALRDIGAWSEEIVREMDARPKRENAA